MAMTLRIPAEIDARIDNIARARHVSKHAVIIEALDRFARDTDRASQVNVAVDAVLSRDSELLKRLEDA